MKYGYMSSYCLEALLTVNTCKASFPLTFIWWVVELADCSSILNEEGSIWTLAILSWYNDGVFWKKKILD